MWVATRVEGQVGQQRGGGSTSAFGGPAGAQAGRDRRHLGAADREPSPVELGPQRERHRLGPVPRRHQRRALVGQQPQPVGQGRRLAAHLDHQGNAASAGATGAGVRRGHGGGDLVGRHGVDAQRSGRGPPPGEWLDPDHPGPGPTEQHGGEQPHRPQAQDDDRLVEHRPGVERDLQRRLDQREQGGDPQVDVAQGHHAPVVGDEAVLVGVEGEHRRADGERRPSWPRPPRRSCSRSGTGSGRCRPARRWSRRGEGQGRAGPGRPVAPSRR